MSQEYAMGWRRAALWANRDDLIADIESPAYERDMAADLAILRQQAARVDEGMVMRGIAAWRNAPPTSSGFDEVRAILKAALSAQPAPHPDDAAVDAFAAAMKAKLAVARAKGRGGWKSKDECSQQQLSDMLRAHVEKGDPRDVANFCMFLHQRGEAIQPAPERQGEEHWFDAAHKNGPTSSTATTHPAAPVGVPAGFVLVPREPTHAMCSAPDAVWHPEARKIWAQMLAAAPSAPVGVPDGMVLVPREALGYVSDLLAERKQGTAGRSPAHNARVVVDYWLAAAPSAPQGTQQGKGNDT